MATNIYDNIDDLLVKVVLEEASEDELALVREWIAGSDENRKYFEGFRQIWEESKRLAMNSSIDENEAWQDFQQLVREAPVVPIAPRRGSSLMKAAAVLILVTVGGWLYYYNNRPAPFLSVRATARVLTDTLPEGSVVTLNKESVIRYKRDLFGNARKVEMEGEAFFSVSPDKTRPFIVQTGETSVTVLGTSFNVKTRADSTEVIVETGMVEVKKGNTRVIVRAHERLVIGNGNAEPVKQDARDKLYNYYRTNEFECEGTPLWRLVEKLNEVYKVHIVIGDQQLKDLKLTVNFSNESLDTMLDIICATFRDYKVTHVTQDGDIVLKIK